MLTSFQIDRFRGFVDFKIGSLKRVNLITGQNNTGKTGLLEAMFLLLRSREAARLPATFRNASGIPDQLETFWRWIFYNREFNIPARLRASFTDHPDVDLRLVSTVSLAHFPELKDFQQLVNIGALTLMIPKNTLLPTLNAAAFTTNPTNPQNDALEFNQAVLQKRKKSIEDLLCNIEPRLVSVDLVQTGARPPAQPSPQGTLLYADLGLSEMIPVTNLGQGFNRLLNIYTAIMTQTLNVLLVDEIENGIHYSALPVFWKGLSLAARQLDIQIFATTHSWECITSAHEVFSQTPEYDFSLHRLQTQNGKIQVVTHDREMLTTAIKSGLEVR